MYFAELFNFVILAQWDLVKTVLYCPTCILDCGAWVLFVIKCERAFQVQYNFSVDLNLFTSFYQSLAYLHIL